jgi:O-antigen ligase
MKSFVQGNLMAYILVISQAIWNPILFTTSSIQVYLASSLLALFTILTSLMRRRSDGTPLQSDHFPFWVYFSFVMLFLLNIFVLGFESYALGNFFRISSMVLMLLFIRQFAFGLEKLVQLYLFLNCGFGTFLVLNFISSGVHISNRISPVGQGSANSFAATLAIILILRLSLKDSYSRGENLLVYFLCFPITFATILGTYSRGAMVGFLVGLLVLGIQQIRFIQTSRILIFICLLFFANEYLNFVSYSSSSLLDSSGRNIIFENALEAYSRNPFFGAGFGSKLNPYSSGEASVHNVFLQVIGETGLIGLGLLIIVLAISLLRYSPRLSIPALSCILIVSLTDNHFLAVQFHLTFGLVYLTLLRDRQFRVLQSS